MDILQRRQLIVAILILLITGSWIVISSQTVKEDRTVPMEAPRQGSMAPGFSLKTLDGEVIQLEDFRGKPVILNFWASWCPPCRVEMPALQAVSDTYIDQGLVVLGVNVTNLDNPAEASRFLDEAGVTFANVLDPDGSVSRLYQARALPTTFFIGPDGVIKKVVIGGPLERPLLEAEALNLIDGGN